MASVNKAIILGNLTRDPETRYMSNGDAVTNLSIATSQTWKDKSTGERKEKSEFHRVTFYRKQAEIVGEYAKKGHQLYVEGRIETRKYQDKTGIDKQITEIIATDFQLLGSRGSGSSQQQNHSQPSQQTGSGFDDMEDDIPF
ncbi:MAG: single-stranded DNA-binding protein [Burkholderiales bacterium]|nr:single-stranded DNA-binding protein [Burkholderiales bacterium]